MQHIFEEIEKLKIKKDLNQSVYQQFLQRLSKNKFTREENKDSHFCVFFLPVDFEKRQVFLVHHIKADDWIPPGGHIDKGEHPLETVKRELKEELQVDLEKTAPKIFYLSRKPIKNRTPCKMHWDIWYFLPIKKREFNFDKSEFYKVEWFDVDDLENSSVFKTYPKAIKVIKNIFPS